ncbi:MAG: type II toxin-antitoxin system HicA family toxin [Methylococcales bacterium]
MKTSQFRRWLKKQGCTFARGKGSHLKVYLGERQSILPMHGSKELGTGLIEKIKKDLGLKE